LCSASFLTEEERLRALVESLQKENARQAAIIQQYQTSASRRLNVAKSKKAACFDFKYVGGCTAGSVGFCQKLIASKSVGGSAVRARHNNKGNCGLSFDKKNWQNGDEKVTFASIKCAQISGCTHFGVNDDAKNKPGSLVSNTIGYIEFSNGGKKCDSSKHSNKAYKTYAIKKCPPPPPSSSPINPEKYQGLKIKNDNAIVSLGKKSDVMLVKTGDSKASLYGSLRLVDPVVVEKGITAKGKVTTLDTLMANGGVKFGMNKGSCDKSRAGTIRYNAQKDTMEFCSAKKAAWQTFASGKPKADGKSAATAGNNCRSIFATFKSSKSGQYWVKPDRWSGSPFKVYCDMTSAPGGWTLVSQGFGGDMPNKAWRGNGPYNEDRCDKLQNHKTASGKTCKLQAKKINALISNDKTGRYKSFTPFPHRGSPNDRNIYSLGTCVYDYTKGLNYNKNTNKENNPCMWSSDKFDMSSPQMQPHRGTQGFEHYKYKGTNSKGFCLHYGSDNVRWWLVDGYHHGDTRAKKINFVLWVY